MLIISNQWVQVALIEICKQKSVVEAATSPRCVQQPQITDGDCLDER